MNITTIENNSDHTLKKQKLISAKTLGESSSSNSSDENISISSEVPRYLKTKLGEYKEFLRAPLIDNRSSSVLVLGANFDTDLIVREGLRDVINERKEGDMHDIYRYASLDCMYYEDDGEGINDVFHQLQTSFSHSSLLQALDNQYSDQFHERRRAHITSVSLNCCFM